MLPGQARPCPAGWTAARNWGVDSDPRHPAADQPHGEFSAVYAGTNEPVPGLTGAACGETLLGISREVFERSAFIRQNNLPISQDAELERRIAALISSGEEGTSYTEAADALKSS